MVPPGVVGPRRPACARSQRRSQRRSRRPEDGRTDVGATSAADRSAVGRPPPPPLPPPLPPPRSRPAGPPTSSSAARSPARSPTGDQEQLLDQLHPFPSQPFFRPDPPVAFWLRPRFLSRCAATLHQGSTRPLRPARASTAR